MTKIVEIISTYPIPIFMMVGILIAAVSTVIEENKRRKNK
jgi:cell division protein FtsL